DRFVMALVDLGLPGDAPVVAAPGVGDLADVDRVGQDPIKECCGERPSAVLFAAAADPSLGGMAFSVEFGGEVDQRSEFEVPVEDGPHQLGLGLDDTEGTVA